MLLRTALAAPAPLRSGDPMALPCCDSIVDSGAIRTNGQGLRVPCWTQCDENGFKFYPSFKANGAGFWSSSARLCSTPC